MLPPKEQAKFLFVCLLRSTAALSYSERSVSSSSKVANTIFSTSRLVPSSSTSTSASSHSNSHDHSSVVSSSSSPTSTLLLEGHIALRLATRNDVPKIQRCNLATLPENYSNNFYNSHLRQWPDLALVAEHVPPGYEVEYNRKNSASNTENKKRINVMESYNPNAEKEFEVVGYVLGKVEEMPFSSSFPQDSTMMDSSSYSSELAPSSRQRSRVHRGNNNYSDHEEGAEDLYRYLQQKEQEKKVKTEILGHVTSLAVLEPYRRCGLAAQLMKQLHVHLKYQYHAKSVGLNVRIGNHAARKLYVEKLGYHVDEVLDAYYQDGEDAFFMKKDLSTIENDNSMTTTATTTYDGEYDEPNTLKMDMSTKQQVSSEESEGINTISKSKPSSVLRRLVQPWWGSGTNGRESTNTIIKNIWEYGPDDYKLPRFIVLNNPLEGQSKKQVKLQASNIGSILDSVSTSRILSADKSMDLITPSSSSQKKLVANSI